MGCLNLTIKRGHFFTIGGDIKIWVEDAHGGYAKLAIDAPREIPILRDNAKVRQPRHRIEKERDDE